MWLVKNAYLLSMIGPTHRDKNQGSCQLLKSWAFVANCYGSYCLASWFVTRGSNLQVWLILARFQGWLLEMGAGFLEQLLQVVGQASIFMYALAAVHLYIQYLSLYILECDLIHLCGFNNHLRAVGSQLHSSSLHFFPGLQIHMSNCLLDISLWTWHSRSKMEFSTFSPKKSVPLWVVLSPKMAPSSPSHLSHKPRLLLWLTFLTIPYTNHADFLLLSIL